ncbi:unnamed protein product [Amoebophrya sp. A120]|nr:unnamed protein product [Amoebophrya sp. A120]|eukprot:GSA120T00003420001.1
MVRHKKGEKSLGKQARALKRMLQAARKTDEEAEQSKPVSIDRKKSESRSESVRSRGQLSSAASKKPAQQSSSPSQEDEEEEEPGSEDVAPPAATGKETPSVPIAAASAEDKQPGSSLSSEEEEIDSESEVKNNIENASRNKSALFAGGASSLSKEDIDTEASEEEEVVLYDVPEQSKKDMDALSAGGSPAAEEIVADKSGGAATLGDPSFSSEEEEDRLSISEEEEEMSLSLDEDPKRTAVESIPLVVGKNGRGNRKDLSGNSSKHVSFALDEGTSREHTLKKDADPTTSSALLAGQVPAETKRHADAQDKHNPEVEISSSDEEEEEDSDPEDLDLEEIDDKLFNSSSRKALQNSADEASSDEEKESVDMRYWKECFNYGAGGNFRCSRMGSGAQIHSDNRVGDFFLVSGRKFQVKGSLSASSNKSDIAAIPTSLVFECLGAVCKADVWYEFSCPKEFPRLEIRMLAGGDLEFQGEDDLIVDKFTMEKANNDSSDNRDTNFLKAMTVPEYGKEPFDIQDRRHKAQNLATFKNMQQEQKQIEVDGNFYDSDGDEEATFTGDDIHATLPSPLCVPAKWQELIPVAMEKRSIAVLGAKGQGKSALLRFLQNKLLTAGARHLYYLDCDLGQPELTPPGFVSLTQIEKPLLYSDAAVSQLTTCGDEDTNNKNIKFLHRKFLGQVTAESDPEFYLESVAACFETLVARLRSLGAEDIVEAKKIVLVVNLPGWITGLGYHLAQTIVNICQIDMLVRLNVETEKLELLAQENSPFESSLLLQAGRSCLHRPLLQKPTEFSGEVAKNKHDSFRQGQDWPRSRTYETFDMDGFRNLKEEELRSAGFGGDENQNRGTFEKLRATVPPPSRLPKELRWLRFSLAFHPDFTVSKNLLLFPPQTQLAQRDLFGKPPLRLPTDILQFDGAVQFGAGNANAKRPRAEFRLPQFLLGALVGMKFGIKDDESESSKTKNKRRETSSVASQLQFASTFEKAEVDYLGFIHSHDVEQKELIVFVEDRVHTQYFKNMERPRLQPPDYVNDACLSIEDATLVQIVVPKCLGSYSWNNVGNRDEAFLLSHVLEGVETGTKVRSSRNDLKRARLE